MAIPLDLNEGMLRSRFLSSDMGLALEVQKFLVLILSGELYSVSGLNFVCCYMVDHLTAIWLDFHFLLLLHVIFNRIMRHNKPILGIRLNGMWLPRIWRNSWVLLLKFWQTD